MKTIFDVTLGGKSTGRSYTVRMDEDILILNKRTAADEKRMAHSSDVIAYQNKLRKCATVEDVRSLIHKDYPELSFTVSDAAPKPQKSALLGALAGMTPDQIAQLIAAARAMKGQTVRPSNDKCDAALEQMGLK